MKNERLTEAEARVALDELRAHGAQVMIGSSRCHITLGHGPEGWYEEAFDEGEVRVQPITEADVRRAMADAPDRFRALPPRPHLRAMRAALAAGDVPEARAHLARAAALGDGLGELAVLDASLADTVTPAQADAIREKLASFTAWHVFMGLVAAWERTPAIAARGLAFADALEARVGLAPGLGLLRASFHGLAGDAAAAAAALRAELATSPPDHLCHAHARSRLQAAGETP